MKLLLFMVVTIVASAMAVEPVNPEDIVSIVITSIISASVLTAIVTGAFQFFINRRNSRISERKNTTDAENDLVTRYREAAAEERSQKESAVQTIKNLLQMTEGQILTLKSTIEVLNATIDTMKKMADAQQDIIDQLTDDRDRIEEQLRVAQEEIEAQKQLLIKHQEEILELTYPKGEIERLREKLNLPVEDVDNSR